jgi:hypothetical protein
LVEGLLQEIEMVDKILKGEDENNIEYKKSKNLYWNLT